MPLLMIEFICGAVYRLLWSVSVLASPPMGIFGREKLLNDFQFVSVEGITILGYICYFKTLIHNQSFLS